MSTPTSGRRSPLALRLAAWSTAAFALAAAFLLIAEYFLLHYVVEVSIGASTGTSSQGDYPEEHDAASRAVFEVANELANTVMLVSAVIAGIMVILAGLATWLVARRSLGRVADVTHLTRQITGSTLNQQLDLPGPEDEIKVLGDTIDDMLRRLHAAFEQQDRFVANASHELRTPLAGIRAVLESSLLHDEVAEKPSQAMTRAIDATQKSESILTALLQLARSRDLASDEAHPIDLAATVAIALEALRDEIAGIGHRVHTNLSDAETTGDQILIMQAVHNLIANAILHGTTNEPIIVTTSTNDRTSVFTVSNGGHVIAPEVAAKLIEPFNRGHHTRHTATPTSGTGLGLPIVDAIAKQHHGTLTLSARDTGGLDVTLTLPASAT
ncbi:sensor histidine kinase [Microbacterium sp.]|uniref:sensor histidine kinase n=1 Tax=Microbacterium sp. TaxID=51671 RepID=UPI003F9480E1